MPDDYDPHRSVSYVLTEVRTVLSRAETALNAMGSYTGSLWPHSGKDLTHIELALRSVVVLLEPWRRIKGKANG